MINTEYEEISGTFDKLSDLIGNLEQLCGMNLEVIHEWPCYLERDSSSDYNELFLRAEELCKYRELLKKCHERGNQLRQAMVYVAYELGVWEEEALHSSIIVILTDSMIANSMLTLTDAKNAGVVEVGEVFQIRFPDGKKIKTELCGPNNRLKERGAFREFYRESELKAGAKIQLSKDPKNPEIWKLEVLSAGYRCGNSSAEAIEDILKSFNGDDSV